MARSKVSQSELIRQALGTGLTTAKEVIEHVKRHHGIVVSDALVYNVKNVGKRKTPSVKRAKPGPKPKVSSNGMLESHAAPRDRSHALAVADIVAVRGLLGRLGSSGLKELVEALV